MKLVEIAKSCGAWLGHGHVTQVIAKDTICMTPDQLRATVEQVCAHQIRALGMGQEVIKGLMDMYLNNKDANYRTINGDKE